MRPSTPSYLEDLAHPDLSEDTGEMIRELGIALLDEFDEFDKYIDSSLPIADDVEDIAYKLLKISDNRTFPKLAASRVTAGGDMCTQGLRKQTLKFTYPLGLDDSAPNKLPITRTPQQAKQALANTTRRGGASKPGITAVKPSQTLYKPPMSEFCGLAPPTSDATRRTRRSNASRINQ